MLILAVIARSDLVGSATQNRVDTDHAGRIAMLDLPGRVERETAILPRTGDVLPRTAHDLIDALAEALGGRQPPRTSAPKAFSLASDM